MFFFVLFRFLFRSFQDRWVGGGGSYYFFCWVIWASSYEVGKLFHSRLVMPYTDFLDTLLCVSRSRLVGRYLFLFCSLSLSLFSSLPTILISLYYFLPLSVWDYLSPSFLPSSSPSPFPSLSYLYPPLPPSLPIPLSLSLSPTFPSLSLPSPAIQSQVSAANTNWFTLRSALHPTLCSNLSRHHIHMQIRHAFNPRSNLNYYAVVPPTTP